MKQLPQEIRKNRLNCQRQIGMLRLFFYVATAGSFAAGASDMVDNAIASALGNFGILLILYRLYRSEERRVGKECRSRWSPYH